METLVSHDNFSHIQTTLFLLFFATSREKKLRRTATNYYTQLMNTASLIGVKHKDAIAKKNRSNQKPNKQCYNFIVSLYLIWHNNKLVVNGIFCWRATADIDKEKGHVVMTCRAEPSLA